MCKHPLLFSIESFKYLEMAFVTALKLDYLLRGYDCHLQAMITKEKSSVRLHA